LIQSKVISYAGWEHCLQIGNGHIDVIVTLDVGPRVIRGGFTNDFNHFVEYADQIGKKGESIYHSYGGHRLWIAPEEHPKTIYPDNAPVQWKQQGEWFHFTPEAEASTGFRKELHISLDPDGNKVRVLHRIINVSAQPQSAAAWGVTVMAPGGRALVPQEPQRPHPASLLPARPLVLWSYTDMSDPRWHWGSRYISLCQDKNATTPQKAGMLNTHGWCAYENNRQLFLKQFPCLHDVQYPDFGCNCEIFTNARMLELESLSPLMELSPNDSITHEEQWYLFRDVNLGSSQDEIEFSLKPIMKLLK
jgi:hypothetical protein